MRSTSPTAVVFVIWNLVSYKYIILLAILNSGVPVKPTSTSNFPSDVNSPIVLTVSLNNVALFSVIPLVSFKFINISGAVGSAFLLDWIQKFCSCVEKI